LAKKIILNFQDKDSEVFQYSKILLFLILISIPVLILYRFLILVPIIIILISLEVINQNTNHGSLVFINKEKSILLEIKPKLRPYFNNSRINILITQELSPWREIPENWIYKIIDKDYLVEFRVNKGLDKLKKEIESSP